MQPATDACLRKEVHKFGGSSVANASAISQVRAIVVDRVRNAPTGDHCLLMVVVSAMGKTTDALIKCTSIASEGGDYSETLAALQRTQISVIEELIHRDRQQVVLGRITENLNELKTVLAGVSALEEASERSRAKICSFGERMSAYIISEVIRQDIPDTDFLDASLLVKTDGKHLHAAVDFKVTNKLIAEHMKAHPRTLYICTGFIGSKVSDNSTMERTLLGRGGSDYSAAIFGAALRSELVLIWTDVDGVMTCDPRCVKGVKRIPRMSYKEAMELSTYGAKVIYAPTMGPTMRNNIPMQIKSTFLPEGEGTIIEHGPCENQHMIRGVSSIGAIAFLTLEGCGMVGVTGVASRLFGALTRNAINVIMISQASSEFSICWAVEKSAGDLAKEAVAEEFAKEIEQGQIDGISMDPHCSIVSVVGEGMVRRPGIMSLLAASLSAKLVNILAIAQGSSERNISIVISKDDEARALNAIHDSFYDGRCAQLNVFIVGDGVTAQAFMALLQERDAKGQSPLLPSLNCPRDRDLDIRVTGLYTTAKSLLDSKDGIQPLEWQSRLQNEGTAMDLQSFLDAINHIDYEYPCVVDCTEDGSMAESYHYLLNKRINVITANLRAVACSNAQARALERLCNPLRGPSYMIHTAISPLVPYTQALSSLTKAGLVRQVIFNLSTTMSYVFNNISATKTFSQAAKEAWDKGLCDQDWHDDFTGLDMARKAVVLSRQCGMHVELEEVVRSALCSTDADINDFPQALISQDELIEKRRLDAEAKGLRLQYVGIIDPHTETVSTSIVEVPQDKHIKNLFIEIHVPYSMVPVIMQSGEWVSTLVAAGFLSDLLTLAGSPSNPKLRRPASILNSLESFKLNP